MASSSWSSLAIRTSASGCRAENASRDRRRVSARTCVSKRAGQVQVATELGRSPRRLSTGPPEATAPIAFATHEGGATTLAIFFVL